MNAYAKIIVMFTPRKLGQPPMLRLQRPRLLCSIYRINPPGVLAPPPTPITNHPHPRAGYASVYAPPPAREAKYANVYCPSP